VTTSEFWNFWLVNIWSTVSWGPVVELAWNDATAVAAVTVCAGKQHD